MSCWGKVDQGKETMIPHPAPNAVANIKGGALDGHFGFISYEFFL
jgi:hypothetical protein